MHGSSHNNLPHLEPRYIGGNNGSIDGVGINLTDSITLARNYAENDGSIYLIDIDISNYLTVSKDTLLSPNQADRLKSILSQLPNELQYRLATDMCGKEDHVFDNDKGAEDFYKKNRGEIREMNLGLDRLKPEIDYHDDGRMMILVAHNDFGKLQEISTFQIHRALNLYDNELASNILKEIAGGLVLACDNNKKNYLSFNPTEAITATLDSSFLSRPNANTLIKGSCEKYSTDTVNQKEKEHQSPDCSL